MTWLICLGRIRAMLVEIDCYGVSEKCVRD